VNLRLGAGLANVSVMHPEATRLVFRDMTPEDIDDMAALLGDPDVMTYYPRPKTRQEAAQWIDWNRGLYRMRGYGLWVLNTAEGDFVGDCGLTPQIVDGVTELEVGYHVMPALQRRGYATEAAAASRDFARTVLGATRLVAIIHPDNRPSQRVAEKIGLRPEKRTTVHGGRDAIIYAAALD
jgi:RimJ/RimL family protein N-acetyltransferase